MNRLEQTPKLVIAALNGHCVGGGLEVAMAADLRVARAGAGKIGLPEVALGVLPGTGGTQRLARLVGKAKAMELMVTGALLTMEAGRDAGLVHQVWGEDVLAGRSFRDTAIDYAKTFAPPHRASRAVGHIKRAVQSGLEAGLRRRAGPRARAAAAAVRERRRRRGPGRQPREAAAALHRPLTAAASGARLS